MSAYKWDNTNIEHYNAVLKFADVFQDVPEQYKKVYPNYVQKRENKGKSQKSLQMRLTNNFPKH